MRPGDLFAVFLVQVTVLFLPLALGLIGLLSGATAGLTSTAAWFCVGIPLSYGVLDRRTARHPKRLAARFRPAARLRVDHAVRS